MIGLPANLFYSTGIPDCVLVLIKCEQPEDVLFFNTSGPGNFTKGKRQNHMDATHIGRIVETYTSRPESVPLDARRRPWRRSRQTTST